MTDKIIESEAAMKLLSMEEGVKVTETEYDGTYWIDFNGAGVSILANVIDSRSNHDLPVDADDIVGETGGKIIDGVELP